MSSLDIRTDMEIRLLERAKSDMKDVLLIYFQSNRMQPRERVLLGEYVKKGLVESTSQTLGFSRTSYVLSHDLILSEKKPNTIDGFKSWVEVLIAKLGISHALSKELDIGVIKPINDKVVECLNGKIKFISEKLGDLNDILRENKIQTTSNSLLRSQVSSLQVQVESLKEEIVHLKTKDGLIVENLSSTTRDQARAIKNNSEIQNMNALIGMLMKQYDAFTSAFEQFQKNKKSAQLVHDSFLDVSRSLESAKNALSDLLDDAWFKNKVAQAVPEITEKITSLADEFSEKRRAKESMPLRQSQAAICRHRVDEIIKKLSRYESSLNGQYFKEKRRGWKTKLPAMKSLIENIKNEQSRIGDDGINSEEIMIRVKDLITFEKKQNGVETNNYKKGTGFKKSIEKALSISNLALKGEIASMDESKSEEPSVSALDEFKDSINITVSDFLNGAAISQVIIDKAKSALTHLSSTELAQEALKESVEISVSVGDKFVSDLKSELGGLEADPAEDIQEYIRTPDQVMPFLRQKHIEFQRTIVAQRERPLFSPTSFSIFDSKSASALEELTGSSGFVTTITTAH